MVHVLCLLGLVAGADWKSWRQESTRFLFDAGPAEYAINHNVPRLGIDMGAD